MKRILFGLVLITSLLFFTGCGQSNTTAADSDKNPEAQDSSTALADKPRISFEKSNPEQGSYLEHVVKLWEQTKPLLREDLAKNYSDEEYKKLGADIDMAWVNLQIHSSFDHVDEVNNITDVKFANLTGDVLMLIDGVYGTRDSGEVEKREERRDNLRQGRLEYKIKEFDETLLRVK